MNEPQQESENYSSSAFRQREELIREAHSLISAIASKPNSLKLLQAVVSSLHIYVGYKTNRRNRFYN